MKNVSSLITALCLAIAPMMVVAQVSLPPRTAVAVESAPNPSTSQPASTTGTSAVSAAYEDDQANMVLFTGTVKQEKLKALPGATVYVKSTRQMAVADENGDFSLELDFSDGPLELEVSYAGFVEQSVTITDPNTFLVISMLDKKKK